MNGGLKTLRKRKNVSTNFFEDMKRYSLSNAQLAQCIEDGILSPDISNLITRPEGNEFVPRRASKDYLSACGVKLAFTLDDDHLHNRTFSYISFFITDFHMLVYKSPAFSLRQQRKTSYYTSSKPAEYYAVPLESILRVELVTGEESIFFSDAITVEVERGDPVLGSAIGAGLFGAAGAIGGALANSGTKTKVLAPARVLLLQDFGLKLYLGDGEEADSPYYLHRLFKIDNAAGTRDRSFNKSINAQLLSKPADSSIPQHCCDELNRLISKAKETRSEEDRAAITKPQFKQAKVDAESDSALGTLIGLLLLGGLIYFWMNF